MAENEKAANGPIPGDLGKIAEEWAKVQQSDIPGYFKSLKGAEVADAQRSQCYPAASFLGSMTGPNKVFAWHPQDSYQGVLFMNNRRPGELYLTGDNNPPAKGPVPAGPFVAKVDATTGKEIWRTYLENGNVSGAWVGAANFNILPDGNIPIAFGNHLVKLDGDTGELATVWTADAATTALQALYRSADRRVLGTARAEPGTTLEQLNETFAPTYKQQALWLEAKTGRILAESSFFEPMNFNTLLTPGFGGRFYYMWDQGFIVLQVMSAD